jgi:cytochrome c oxidase subunit 2
MAADVDRIFLVLLLLTVFFTVLVTALIVAAAVRYRRRSREQIGRTLPANARLEWGGMAFLGVLSLGMFLWAGGTYVRMYTPPPDAETILVTGRMWMWKAQHQNGIREQNTLHVEVNKPVKLIMTSEDVIHSFYVPAFRIHTDLLPGRYTSQWFTPTKVGTYRLMCSEYCGTGHSVMGGNVIVMNAEDFQAWIGGGGASTTGAVGEQLFQQQGCVACHSGAQGAPGPAVAGLFGEAVELADGQTVIADENYLRESILNPSAKIVKGYQPIMPSYEGRLTDDQVFALVTYIESLGPRGASPSEGTGAPGETGTPSGQATPAEAGTPSGAGGQPGSTPAPPTPGGTAAP